MKNVLLAIGSFLLLSVPLMATANFNTGYYYGKNWFQNRVVTGRITNENGEPLANATIQVKGTKQTTLSSNDGTFSIDVPASAKALIISYSGMQIQEVAITHGQAIDVRLTSLANTLADVVVVGYGTQKKANLTGSVSTVSGNTLTQRPAPNAANLLEGRVAGLQVTQPSAEPGRDNPTLLIRGRGSFSGGTSNDPLVLVDGVTGSLNNLSPDDIDNITVLKDAASASIYGARAANGVILVTTKKGRSGKTVVNYRFNIGQHTAIGLPKFITNSAEYMSMFNTAAKRSGLDSATVWYPQTEIDKYRNATDLNQYPNFDAIDYYFRPAMVVNHNISVSGGTDKNTFNLSLGYLDQNTFLKQYNYKRYNGLLNYTNKVSDKVSIGTIMNLTYSDREEPPVTSQFMALSIYATGPLYGPYLPDGSGRVASKAYNREGRNRNPSEYYLMGNQYTRDYNMNAQAFMDVKLLDNLTWSSKVAVNYADEFFKMHQVPYQAYLTQEKDPATGDYKMVTFGPDILGVTDQYTKAITPTVYSTLNYNTTIAKDHNITVLGGYEQLYYKIQSLRARRQTSAAPALDELSGYSSATEFVNYFPGHPRLPSLPSPIEWAMQSVFGRVNYNYKGKYLLEGDLRYDGTSKVSPDYRWGLFPSISAGWIISKEDFFSNITRVNNLKLRASYGTLGNQDIGTYLYQNTLDISGGYPFGNTSFVQGAVVNSFKDQSIRWESTKIADVGFDLNAWRGLLGVTFDWFQKTTSDILATQPIPQSIGLNAPTFNNGSMRNTGVELELTHQNHIGAINYGFNGQIATVNNKVLSIKVPSKGTTIRDVGLPYDAFYLYVWDGIFQQSDIGDPKVPKHALNPNPKPGDLKMKDINGDGVVDANDRVVVSGAYPDYTYSFGFNVGYKGFNLNTFFQGVQGIKARQTGWGVDPFMQGTPPTVNWRNAWTPQNPTNTLPALYAASYPGVTNYQGSTFYLQDASYLRLKNIVLSYTLPKALLARIRSTEMTVYVSADNLLTFTKFQNGDPERASASLSNPVYPQARILSGGLNVKF
jgi:TonB-linked SusC/RagA family outer membrane protein